MVKNINVPTGANVKYYIEAYDAGYKDCKLENCTEENTSIKPTYYNDTNITPFQVINDWELDFYLGNAIKYIKRAGKKDNNSRLQDLKKVATYISEEIKLEEAKYD